MKNHLKMIALGLMSGVLFWFLGNAIEHWYFPQHATLWLRLADFHNQTALETLVLILLFLFYGFCLIKDVNEQARRLQYSSFKPVMVIFSM
jgi:hypothetical protein